MASTYSDRLRIQLIGNGEQSGTWGNTTNTNLGVLVEEAIAGVVSIAMSDANYTLSVANGATDESRQAVLVVSGSLSTMRDVICPAEEKIYVIKNGTSGAQSIRLKTSAGTGVIVPNGQTTILYCDGTNVLPAVDTLPGNSWINGTLLVSGATSIDNSVIINDSGADKDFRVEGDTNQNLLFTDASTDRVGIGTGTPAARLHVLTNDGGTNTRLSGASYALRFQSVAATGSVFDATSADESTYQPLLIGGSQIRLTLSGTEVARLVSPGYLGFGTNSPGYRLDVNETNPVRGVISQLGNNGSSGLTGAQLAFLQSTVNWWTIGQPAATDAFAIWSGRHSGSDGTERMRIDSSGNVGIGTSTPAANLHVQGTIRSQGDFTLANGTGFKIYPYYISSTNHNYIGAEGDGSMSFGTSTTSPTERMRLTEGGNLLVGSTSSTSARVVAIANTGSSASHGVYGEVSNKTGSGFYGVYGLTSVSASHGSGGVIGLSRDGSTYGISGYFDGTNHWSFYGNGNALTSGTWQTSDARLKDNVQTITGSVSLLSALRPVSFDWKPDSDAARAGSSHDYGLIAQEVSAVLPDIVRQVTAPPAPDGGSPSLNNELGSFYIVEYSRLIPHLISAVKELKAELDVVKAELETLKGA